MKLPGGHAVWQSLLPEGVHGCAGFEAPAVDRLSPAELRSIAGVGEHRLREFRVGRSQARLALAVLGIAAPDILRRADGAPAWPPGVVGSLAHAVHRGRPFAVAAVADKTCCAALGVDVEAPGRIEPRHWASLFLPAELAALLGLPMPSRSRAASLRWSAKEAAFKACGGRVGLRDTLVTFDDDTGRFVATGAGGRTRCEGRALEAADGWVFAVAHRRPD